MTTQRYRIEPLKAADAKSFVAYRQDSEVARSQSWDLSYAVEDAAQLLEGHPVTNLPAKCEDCSSPSGCSDRALARGRFVHMIEDHFHTYEIGVALARSSQSSGIATEAVSCVVQHLFREAATRRVVAYSDSRNESVARLLTRVGMRQESRAVETDFFAGRVDHSRRLRAHGPGTLSVPRLRSDVIVGCPVSGIGT